MRLIRESSGEQITLSSDHELGFGGEARILEVASRPDLAAKVYHRLDPTRPRKLAAMLSNPPEDPMAGSSHISIAWPLDRLSTADDHSRVVGYLMPRVGNTLPVFQYYNPASRRRRAPLFSYRYLLRAARNLAAAVGALHQRGYVIGDLNESNILVTSTALVTLVDTDSFQVPESGTGHVFRCTVGKPEYTPPEIQGSVFADFDRCARHDLFGLAVIVFQLLMEGTHPFAGEYLQGGDPPPYEERILSGHFPYQAGDSLYRPAAAAPPFSLLNPLLQSMIQNCFREGYRNPEARPDAHTWQAALQDAEDQLKVCDANEQHCYSSHLPGCPWCVRREMLGGRDPFPSREEVEEYPAAHPPSARAGNDLQTFAALPAPLVFGPTIPAAAFKTQLPANPWSWAALAVTLASIAAYTSGASIFSAVCAAAAAACAVTAAVRAARTSQRGEWLARSCLIGSLATGAASALAIHNVLHPPQMRVIPMVSSVRTVAFSADGKTLVTGTNRAEDQRLIGGQVQEWDPATAQAKQTIAEYSGNVAKVSITPDGSTVVAAAYSPLQTGEVDLLDARYKDVKTLLESVGTAQPVEALSPDGDTVAIGNLAGTVDFRSIKTRSLVSRGSVSGEILAVTFSPAGRLLAVASGSPPGSIVSGTVSVLNVATGTRLWSDHAHGNAVLAAAFIDNGRYLVTGGNDSRLTIWNAATGAKIKQIETQAVRTEVLEVSPDGRYLAAAIDTEDPAAEGYPICIWGTSNWALLRKLTGHRARVTSLAYSPDGAMLVSGGMDATLRLWRLTDR